MDFGTSASGFVNTKMRILRSIQISVRKFIMIMICFLYVNLKLRTENISLSQPMLRRHWSASHFV